MLAKTLKFFGYKTFYFVSYVAHYQGCEVRGSMNLTVAPFIHKGNYNEALQEISRCSGEKNVSVLSISKL